MAYGHLKHTWWPLQGMRTSHNRSLWKLHEMELNLVAKRSEFSRYVTNSHIRFYKPSLWPWPSREQTNLLAWHSPVMMHHHTKLVFKRLSSWGDITQMNNHWNYEPFLWPWPWPQQSHPIFLQENPTFSVFAVKPSCKRISSSEDRKSYFDYMILHYDLDLADSKPIFFERHSGSRWCITIPNLLVKGSVVQKISSGQTFIDLLKFCWDHDLEHRNPVSS